MKLSLKFGLVICLLLGLALGVNSWLFLRNQAESMRLQEEAIRQAQAEVRKEAEQRALAVLSFGESCREYARNTLSPAIAKHNQALLQRVLAHKDDPEAVLRDIERHSKSLVFEGQSATFLARGVFASLGKRLKDYSFREASLNPLNPHHRADPEEERLIRRVEMGSQQ